MIVLGIDPGLSGGLAVVAAIRDEPARLLEAIDVPTTGENAKRRVHVSKVVAFIRSHNPDHAVIERAQAMPDQGSSSGFIYGRAVGALEATIEGMCVPLTVIEPTAWKKAHALMRSTKEDSRQRAIRLFPRAPAFPILARLDPGITGITTPPPANRGFFDRVMDHNRAEAALIAWFGLMLLDARPDLSGREQRGFAG